MMDIPVCEFRVGPDIALQHLLSLYASVGWTAYTAPERRADLARAVRNSSFVITAWRDQLLVGLARCLSDDVAIVYIQDVLVRPEYQGHGVGTHLVEACLERYQHVRMAVLLTDTDPVTSRFYQRLGFSRTGAPGTAELDAFVRLTEPNSG